MQKTVADELQGPCRKVVVAECHSPGVSDLVHLLHCTVKGTKIWGWEGSNSFEVFSSSSRCVTEKESSASQVTQQDCGTPGTRMKTT